MLALLVVGEKAELAGSKTLAITLGRRSVVHAARIQRPSCSICPRARCGGDSATTGRVLQSFEHPLSESLSAGHHPSYISASRRGDGAEVLGYHRHAIAASFTHIDENAVDASRTQALVMLLKSFVRTGTLLAGARAFAPLSIQRRAFTKMSAAPIGVMVTVEIEEARVRSRRPVVLWWFHFIVMSRLRE